MPQRPIPSSLLLLPATRLLVWATALACLAPSSTALARFGQLSLKEARASFVGVGDNEQAGWAVAMAGDVNSDGFQDLLIGAPFVDQAAQDAGCAWLIYGSNRRFGGPFDLTQAEGAFLGETLEDYAGSSVAGVGDVNGDGYDDVLVGAWANDEGGGSAGKVYLIYGGPQPPGELSLEGAGAAFLGESTGDVAGLALAAAGDVNGDGYADFLIGAPRADVQGLGDNVGRAYLVLGAASGLEGTQSLAKAPLILEGLAGGDYFGYALSGGPDLDGDGRSDLIVGAYGSDEAGAPDGADKGAAWLFFSSSLTWPATGHLHASAADVRILGASSGDQLGSAVALSPDVDGDALPDLLLGAWSVSSRAFLAGAGVYLSGAEALLHPQLSPSDGTVIFGEAVAERVGQGVAVAGDVDRDGRTDLLLAAPRADTPAGDDAGRVAFLPGAASLSGGAFQAVPDQLLGEASTGLAGFSLAGGGDVDADGHPDLLIGAPAIGHAYLILTGDYFDDDGDGLTELTGDCDDGEASSHPGGLEVPYDGIDQDCDGEDLGDVDGDGFTAVEVGGLDCDDSDPAISPTGVDLPNGLDDDCDGVADDGSIYGDDDGDGQSEVAGDCNDGLASVYPGAPEVANGVDDDCDGRVDEALPGTDDDGDGLSELEGDCDDGNAAVYPGAVGAGPQDWDCDGQPEVPGEVLDGDQDGFTASEGDLDDEDASIHPGATELPDGKDNDGDGLVDEGTADLDGDGFSEGEGDPDDGNASSYPGAVELADGKDNDGDGLIDEGTADLDGDGFSEGEGDPDDSDASSYPGAVEQLDGVDNDGDGQVDEGTADLDGDGFSEGEGDPDDGDASSYPGAVEIADGLDNDGDGQVDEGTVDADGDGYSEAQGDPDDGDASSHPGAVELPDGKDNDGDGLIDEGTADADGDGFSEAQGDPDDGDASSHPGAAELPDGKDNDGDGEIDEGTVVRDDDGDGYAELDEDCADGDPSRYPGALEVCDGVDNSCDGRIDEGCEGDDDTPPEETSSPTPTERPEATLPSGDDDDSSPGGWGPAEGETDAPGPQTHPLVDAGGCSCEGGGAGGRQGGLGSGLGLMGGLAIHFWLRRGRRGRARKSGADGGFGPQNGTPACREGVNQGR